MESTEIRKRWKQFRETNERNHTRASPASLIVRAADDPTTLFNTAGMQQFVPYLMGKEHPDGTRLYNIQGCVRTTDIEEVGDLSHLTYFEMMGNRSLGDYFKQESIQWSREFLTDSDEGVGIDPDYLAVSVFAGDDDAPKDQESAQLREDIGIPPARIAYLPKSENRWGPAGATGPCGPDTEIFYRVGPGEPPEQFDPAADEEHWLEIWNNVFMAYYQDENGNFSELDQKNVDTGMGFERLCVVLQDKKTVFDTDLFKQILVAVSSSLDASILYPFDTIDEELSDDEQAIARRMRIIADHLRTAIYLIDEGLVPSNEGRGYVLRKLVRRAFLNFYLLEEEGDTDDMETIVASFHELIDATVAHLQEVAGSAHDLAGKKITPVLEDEIRTFSSTLTKGFEEFTKLVTDNADTVPGKVAFTLYDTHGFPVELTQEMAADQGMKVDMEGFKQAMQAAKEQSRKGSEERFAKDIDWAAYIDELPPTQFVGYDQLEADVNLLKDFEVDGQRVLVFNKTPMYAEGGGQTADTGKVELDSGEEVYIRDVQKYGGVWLHFVS